MGPKGALGDTPLAKVFREGLIPGWYAASKFCYEGLRCFCVILKSFGHSRLNSYTSVYNY